MALIRLSREVKDNLGEDPPMVVRGKHPWLFLGEAAYRDEYEGVATWPDAQAQDWVEALRASEDNFASAQIPLAVTIAPDKARIYPEFLPKDWREGRRRFKSAVLDDPRLATMTLDTEPALLAHKAQTGEQVYYARDTHWNASGGAVSATMIMDRLDPENTLERAPVSDPDTRPGKRVYDLEAMIGTTETQEPESLRRRFPSLPGYTVTRPHLLADGTPERGALHTIIVTDDRPRETQKTLVVIGDSFTDAMMPYLKWPYDRVVRIHHGAGDYTVGTDEVLSYNPDAVLIMIVERSAHRKSRPLVIGPSIDADGNPMPLP